MLANKKKISDSPNINSWLIIPLMISAILVFSYIAGTFYGYKTEKNKIMLERMEKQVPSINTTKSSR